jgi:hypothetical protein
LNQQDIQKLRKALETGRDAAQEVAERCHQEFAGYKEHRHKAVDADVAEIETALEMIALAERAVSPAESVQSIDTPEFRSLLGRWHAAGPGTHTVTAFLNFVAHIDASRAAAYERGYDDGHIAGRDKGKRSSTEEAHAEGRRSAMEELHPQWLKEKERADRAEQALADKTEAYKAMTNCAQEYQQLAQKAREEADELAAKQVPDLTDKQIMALWAQCSMPSEENDFITGPLPFARALLAQPLQQEGGKVLSRAIDCLEILNKRPRPMCRDCADEDGVCPHDKLDCDMRKLISDARAALSQPADNLQQASTAQAEPTKECGNCFEGKSDMDHACRACSGTGVATTPAKEASTATDVWQRGQRIELRVNGKWVSARFIATDLVGGEPIVQRDGAMPVFATWNEVRSIDHPTTAQATPEGADLPPLPDAYYKALDGDVFTPQQMRDYARAALAASQQAAEPVAMADVLAAIRTVDKEAERRGGMFPQDADEHRADRRAVQRVLGMLKWYGDRQQCEKWKEWPRRAAPPQQVDTKIIALLREARSTLEMWKDVAPAISLCRDIDAALAQKGGASNG